jgi:hypothetical protein|tara:strand:+ start:1229 stop:1471 length:243 start_codon:yes stop_codon:yes gene_type:complete
MDPSVIAKLEKYERLRESRRKSALKYYYSKVNPPADVVLTDEQKEFQQKQLECRRRNTREYCKKKKEQSKNLEKTSTCNV